MNSTSILNLIRPAIMSFVMVAAFAASGFAQDKMHQSQMFKGDKANTGFVTHSKNDGKHVLTLSDDFVSPDTPAPHWQVVDSAGNVYLLNRLMIKDDKFNKSITLPEYIKDVAKVQIWCSWAEALLGEAPFDHVQK